MIQPNRIGKAVAGPLCLMLAIGCEGADRTADETFPVLTGPYLGQTPPGDEPQLFAPGIVSTGMYTRDIAMTPDGREIYFCVMESGFSIILVTKLVDGRWTKPEVVPFSADAAHQEIEPHITQDGSRMFFLSDRRPDGLMLEPEERGQWANQKIWAVDRVGDGWGEPYILDAPVNSDSSEFFPSVTADGTMYFTRSDPETRDSYIYRSRFVDGVYLEPERLPAQVNTTTSQYNAFIAPDESYIIVPAADREDSYGGTDYYVSFRNEADEWSDLINLGEYINTPTGGEFSAFVSPDGLYFFFMSSRRTPWEERPETLTREVVQRFFSESGNGRSDIYWVSAGFLDSLRQTARFD